MIHHDGLSCAAGPLAATAVDFRYSAGGTWDAFSRALESNDLKSGARAGQSDR
jgi:hypothetical protein